MDLEYKHEWKYKYRFGKIIHKNWDYYEGKGSNACELPITFLFEQFASGLAQNCFTCSFREVE